MNAGTRANIFVCVCVCVCVCVSVRPARLSVTKLSSNRREGGKAALSDARRAKNSMSFHLFIFSLLSFQPLFFSTCVAVRQQISKERTSPLKAVGSVRVCASVGCWLAQIYILMRKEIKYLPLELLANHHSYIPDTSTIIIIFSGTTTISE